MGDCLWNEPAGPSAMCLAKRWQIPSKSLMMLLSEFWSAEDSPGLRRASVRWAEIKHWVCQKSVKLLKIVLSVLFIGVYYLISSPFMVFSSQQGWDWPYRWALSWLRHVNLRKKPWEAALKGNWGRGDCRQSDSRQSRVSFDTFNADSLGTLIYSQNR